MSVSRGLHQSSEIGVAVGCWYSCMTPNGFTGVVVRVTSETVSMGDTRLLALSMGEVRPSLLVTPDNGTSCEASSKTFQVGQQTRLEGTGSVVTCTALPSSFCAPWKNTCL
jgi:hypothetical protein